MFNATNGSSGRGRASAGAASAVVDKSSSFTPDPVIGHLINVMKKVGPKLPQGDIEVDPTEMDPEEEHEFLEQLLRSRELNCLVKMHNVILFCNQEQCPCVSNCC